MALVVEVQGSPGPWPADAMARAVAQGQLHPQTPVSFDGGRTWVPAGVAATRLQARGDDAFAALVPMRTEGWSTGAGYVALFSLLFFGGPISIAVVAGAFDPGPKLVVRLLFVVGGLVLGPLPPAAMALLGLRALRRDPTLRGKGRAIFALVCAALMTLTCLSGLVGIALHP